MTDSIRITGLELFGHHGVFDFEKHDGQRFLIDLTVWLETDRASHSDDLNQTLDYSALVNKVAEVVQGEPLDLIETLASRVLDVVWGFDQAHSAEVTIHKPDAPVEFPVADISVTMKRERSQP